MQKDAGFTLMELMVTVGILAVLAAIAIPSIIGGRGSAQLGRAARDVYSNFQKAKFEAGRRNTPCTVTFRANDYVIYVDANDDWIYQAGEEITSPVPWSDYPGVRLDVAQGGGDGLSFTNPVDGIEFTPNGFAGDNTGTLAGGTVFLIGRGSKTSTIVISPAGNVRIE